VDRRTFVASAIALLTTPLAVEAQLAAKVYRIGVLSTAGPEQENVIWADLRGRLRERGWVEGRTSPLNGATRKRSTSGVLHRQTVEILSQCPDQRRLAGLMRTNARTWRRGTLAQAMLTSLTEVPS
jgi:hypothetical protein